MRLVMFQGTEAVPRPGLVDGDAVVPLPAASLAALIGHGRTALDHAAAEATRSGDRPVPLADVALAAPLAPAVVVAPGPSVPGETGDRLGRHREFYLKSAHTVVAAADALPYRDALGTLSYRAQLGLVLAPGRRHLDAGAVLDHVIGAVVAAELYSVDLLRVGWEGTMWHVRYGEGASFDGACPIGPFFVTRDEIDLEALQLEDAAGADDVQEQTIANFVAYVSRWMELGPNALVLAGSNHGPRLTVEGGNPVVVWPEGEPRLAAGDRVSARATGLGEIDVVVGAQRVAERR